MKSAAEISAFAEFSACRGNCTMPSFRKFLVVHRPRTPTTRSPTMSGYPANADIFSFFARSLSSEAGVSPRLFFIAGRCFFYGLVPRVEHTSPDATSRSRTRGQSRTSTQNTRSAPPRDQAKQIAHPVRIAPLVVVPTEAFQIFSAADGGEGGVEDRGMGIADDIRGHHR